jgi:hypothetical protein
MLLFVCASFLLPLLNVCSVSFMRQNERGGRPQHTPNPKRQHKNAKFGAGGKKHGLRVNNGTSASDMSGFRDKANKSVCVQRVFKNIYIDVFLGLLFFAFVCAPPVFLIA